MATYLQLVQKAARNCPVAGGGPVSVLDTSPEENVLLINFVADEWADLQTQRTDWRWLRKKATFALTPNTSVYTPATIGASVADVLNLAAWERVFRAQRTGEPDVPVSYMEEDRFVSSYTESVPTSTGFPVAVTVRERDQALWFYPVPDAAYTVHLRFTVKPTALTVDGSTPDMPSNFHDILVWGAVERWAYHQEAQSKAVYAASQRGRLFDNLVRTQTDPVDLGWNPLA